MPTAQIRGLVLDRTHRVLVNGKGMAPELVCEWPDRPLKAFRAYMRKELGLELDSPWGYREPNDGRGPCDFLFIIDKLTAPADFSWQPLARASENRWIWQAYVEMVLAGWEPPTRTLDVVAFGGNTESASKLAHLVGAGHKRGTAAWREALGSGDETLAEPGMVSIVTDAFGAPRCAIVTTGVRRLAFGNVDAEAAEREGEGDRTLAEWSESHRKFFENEAALLGLSFNDSEEVLIEAFKVLHIIGRRDSADF